MRICEQVDGWRVDTETEDPRVRFFARARGWTAELVQEAVDSLEWTAKDLKDAYDSGYQDAEEEFEDMLEGLRWLRIRGGANGSS